MPTMSGWCSLSIDSRSSTACIRAAESPRLICALSTTRWSLQRGVLGEVHPAGAAGREVTEHAVLLVGLTDLVAGPQLRAEGVPGPAARAEPLVGRRAAVVGHADDAGAVVHPAAAAAGRAAGGGADHLGRRRLRDVRQQDQPVAVEAAGRGGRVADLAGGGAGAGGAGGTGGGFGAAEGGSGIEPGRRVGRARAGRGHSLGTGTGTGAGAGAGAGVRWGAGPRGYRGRFAGADVAEPAGQDGAGAAVPRTGRLHRSRRRLGCRVHRGSPPSRGSPRPLRSTIST